jgi:hypothetical protein
MTETPTSETSQTAQEPTAEKKGMSLGAMLPLLHTVATFGVFGRRGVQYAGMLNTVDNLMKQGDPQSKGIITKLSDLIDSGDGAKKLVGATSGVKAAIGNRKDAVGKVLGENLSPENKAYFEGLFDKMAAIVTPVAKAVTPHVDQFKKLVAESPIINTAGSVLSAAVKGQPVVDTPVVTEADKNSPVKPVAPEVRTV